MTSALDDCIICGRKIGGEESAIGVSVTSGQNHYVPFVEDLRTTDLRLVHPLCFIKDRGVETLVAVIHQHDQKERKGFWKMVDEIDGLRRQLGGQQ